MAYCRLIYIVLFSLLLAPNKINAFINAEFDGDGYCVKRNTLLFGNTLIRYFGPDSILSEYENVKYKLQAEIDSVGNVSVKNFLKLRKDSTNHLRIKTSLDPFALQDFLQKNHIRFSACIMNPSENPFYFGVDSITQKTIHQNSIKTKNKTDINLVWPETFILDERDRQNFIYEAKNILNAFPLTDSDTSDHIQTIVSTNEYNSAILFLYLSYIFGDWNIIEWIEQDPFEINVIVDNNGKLIDVTPQDSTPIDVEAVNYIREFISNQSISLKIPVGAKTLNYMNNEYYFFKVPFKLFTEYPHNSDTKSLRNNFRYAKTIVSKKT